MPFWSQIEQLTVKMFAQENALNVHIPLSGQKKTLQMFESIISDLMK